MVAMTLLLLDANVWLASRNNREDGHVAARRLVATAARRPFAALDLTLYEVANIAVKAWRSAAAAQRITDLVRAACARNIVGIDGELLARTIAVADHHGLSAYDAAYVAAAEINGWTLVSGDRRDLVGPGLAITAEQALAAGY
ncbi:MAG: PIN domain-containing protein [Actinobacteria bacterium]|nr:PIN domain-containing protein [Actinomycetota bacterium]